LFSLQGRIEVDVGKNKIAMIIAGMMLMVCMSGCVTEPVRTVRVQQAAKLPADFAAATLVLANRVATLLEYDYDYYRPYQAALHAWAIEKDPAEKEVLWKKLMETERRNHEINHFKHAWNVGVTVCGGYSKVFYKMAEEAGYDVYYLVSSTHAYNAILFEGRWYFFDVTWYDDNSSMISYLGSRKANYLKQSTIWEDFYHTSRLSRDDGKTYIMVYKLDKNYQENAIVGKFEINSSGIPEFLGKGD
jgi:hypothetical protein